jgi:hypothetical protein
MPRAVLGPRGPVVTKGTEHRTGPGKHPPQTARFAWHGAATPRSGQAADKDGHGGSAAQQAQTQAPS